ncbi:MAG: cytochrome C [Granulosicoccus sp.]|nr:cytochrome C [Granulosicoccus sp.]
MITSMVHLLKVSIVLVLIHSSVAAAQDNQLIYEPRPDEFVNSCSSCHGRDAKGAGFLTRVFKGVNPGDLTQLSRENNGKFPFDRVYEVIDGRADVAAHGERAMPVWGDRYMNQSMNEYGPDETNVFRVRNRILELVHYLQSIQDGP